ncbi:glycosyltransferase [Millisia brevis]|uniref:glycosyltransferase n=1 Tax=Millisia brevis TaxID=264148 RepID=UPI000B0F0F63|nr:glycosyltransferase [Millisia brevis]
MQRAFSNLPLPSRLRPLLRRLGLPAVLAVFLLVMVLTALPGSRTDATSSNPEVGYDAAQSVIVGGAAPAAVSGDDDDATGNSGGVLPRADGVQALPAPDVRTAYPDAPESLSTGWGTVLISVVLAVVALALTVVASTTLWWMLHAWRTPRSLVATGFTRRSARRPHSFSLLLPARHEQEVLGDTIDSLAMQDHPDFEIIAIIGHDDPETEAVARAAQRRHPDRVRVIIDHNVPKNKPKALNRALPACAGEITGVFDAEDEVHPGLLRLIEARFEETGADVVQAGVQLMNVHSSWWSLRNCLEYYFWFRSRLHFHAQQRFIPLGGNTVFTKTELLRAHGGWDPECLAEDCEIGVRLSAAGATVAVAYDPDAVTREETPDSIPALIKQRTRWNQGFLQVLRKKEWRRLPTRRQRWLARYTLAMPFLQAATGLLIPLSLAAMLLVKVPVPITLLTFLPLTPTIVTVAVEMAGLGEFSRAFGVRLRWRDRIRLVLGAFPYQLLLAFAALRSVWREARGRRGWEKTAHSNLHRTPSAAGVA